MQNDLEVGLLAPWPYPPLAIVISGRDGVWGWVKCGFQVLCRYPSTPMCVAVGPSSLELERCGAVCGCVVWLMCARRICRCYSKYRDVAASHGKPRLAGPS